MDLESLNGFTIDSVENRIIKSITIFFRFYLKFIFTSIFEIEISEKNSMIVF